MYTIAALLVLAIALGGVVTVFNSLLDVLTIKDTIRGHPLIGAHIDAGIAILLVWLLDISLLERFLEHSVRADWIHIVIDGLIIYGMIPVKDAIVGAITKGLRA